MQVPAEKFLGDVSYSGMRTHKCRPLPKIWYVEYDPLRKEWDVEHNDSQEAGIWDITHCPWCGEKLNDLL